MRAKYIMLAAAGALGAVLTFQQCAKVKYVIPDDPAAQAAAVDEIAEEFCVDGETFPGNSDLGEGICCIPKPDIEVPPPEAVPAKGSFWRALIAAPPSPGMPVCVYTSCHEPRILNEQNAQCELIEL